VRSLEQIRQELDGAGDILGDHDENAEQAQRDAALPRQRVERKPLNPEPGLGDFISG